MDRPAIGRTLRNRAFVAPMAHTNPMYAITFLALYPSLGALSGLVGQGSLWSTELVALTAVHPEKEVRHIELLFPPPCWMYS